MRSGLDRIRVQDVVGDLGLTSGAFYNLWDNLEAYRADDGPCHAEAVRF